MVQHCVLMQLDYLNIKHPDFAKAEADATKKFNEASATSTADEEVGSTNVLISTRATRPAHVVPAPRSKPSYTREPEAATDYNDEEERRPQEVTSQKPVSRDTNRAKRLEQLAFNKLCQLC